MWMQRRRCARPTITGGLRLHRFTVFYVGSAILFLTPGVPAAQAIPTLLAVDILPPASETIEELCQPCNLDLPNIVMEQLDADIAGTAAASISDWNLALIARADSLKQAGFFGSPESAAAAIGAARYFKYQALTALDLISYLSTRPNVAWETSGPQISSFYRSFANPGIYPVWGLRRALLGGGTFCMEYDVDPESAGQRMLGIRPIKLHSAKVKVDGRKHQAWSMELPTSNDGTADLNFCEQYSGRIRRFLVEDDDQVLSILVLEEMEGLYVKRWGMHKCSGIVLWRSYLPDGEWPPRNPVLGGAAYFPALKLNLPGFIPDVNLDDLRAFPAFQPLIAADHFGDGSLPDWLPVGNDGIFQDWYSEGEIPAVVRSWFPDL